MAPMIWIALCGLSLLFVGGFVLWVYGTRAAHPAHEIEGPEAEATRSFYNGLANWFWIYGGVAVAAGILCLLITLFVHP